MRVKAMNLVRGVLLSRGYCTAHAGPEASEIDPALESLIAQSEFRHARTLLDFGCGTGRLAGRLLARESPLLQCALVDVSERHVELARERLEVHISRGQVTAEVLPCPHEPAGPGPYSAWPSDHYDRFAATYVLDFLPEDAIAQAVQTAHRVLKADGKLCYVGLTPGTWPLHCAVSDLWLEWHSQRGAFLSHRRPIAIRQYLAPSHWHISHRSVTCPFLLCNEVVVATPIK